MRRGAPRFRVDERELKMFTEEAPLIRPGMSEDQAVRARDAMGHLIRGLRGAEAEITRLEAGIEEREEQIDRLTSHLAP